MPGSERIRVQVDPDLEDLVPIFLENRERDAEALRAALERGDFEEIRFIGHSMKGAGGGYGFHRVTELGEELERSAVDRRPERVSEILAELEDYMARVEIVFE